MFLESQETRKFVKAAIREGVENDILQTGFNRSTGYHSLQDTSQRMTRHLMLSCQVCRIQCPTTERRIESRCPQTCFVLFVSFVVISNITRNERPKEHHNHEEHREHEDLHWLESAIFYWNFSDTGPAGRHNLSSRRHSTAPCSWKVRKRENSSRP
jgi:hypothetical protein